VYICIHIYTHVCQARMVTCYPCIVGESKGVGYAHSLLADDAEAPGLQVTQGVQGSLGTSHHLGIGLGVEGLVVSGGPLDQDLRDGLTLGLELFEAILYGHHELLGDTRLLVPHEAGALELPVHEEVGVLLDGVGENLGVLQPVQLGLLLSRDLLGVWVGLVGQLLGDLCGMSGECVYKCHKPQ
jgi:hypothetical protein